MSFTDPEHSPCVTCPLRPASFCGALLGHHAERQPLQNPLRQTFGGADAYQTIYYRDDISEDFYILCHGWAAGVIQLSDGRRQILSVLLAGDPFSTTMLFQKALHFSIQALTPVRFSRINRDDLKARLCADSKIHEALGRVCIEESKASDQLIVDLGRRTADERIANLILSLAERMESRNAVTSNFYPFPLRQQDIADVLGLTPVHVSRVITKFRKAKLIDFSSGKLQILNRRELNRIGRLK